MATKPNTAEVADVLVPETPTNNGVAIRSSFELGVIEGESNMADMQLPRLHIAYGVGRLAEHFHPGDWVLGEDNLLAGKGEPLTVIILTATSYWKEYLAKFDPNVMPRIFETEAEVLAAGGTTQWVGPVGPTFNKAMNIKMLIEKPADLVCGLFGINIEDKTYAVATWDIDKSAYRSVGPVLITAANLSLKKRTLLGGSFQLTTKTKRINDNVTVIPSLRLIGFNSDEVIAGIRNLFDS